jgi:hypothetical protein
VTPAATLDHELDRRLSGRRARERDDESDGCNENPTHEPLVTPNDSQSTSGS